MKILNKNFLGMILETLKRIENNGKDDFTVEYKEELGCIPGKNKGFNIEMDREEFHSSMVSFVINTRKVRVTKIEFKASKGEAIIKTDDPLIETILVKPRQDVNIIIKEDGVREVSYSTFINFEIKDMDGKV